MKNLQKMGGVAALFLALANIILITIFIVVLDYPSITDPAQKMALVVEQPNTIYLTNILGYVLFGVFLVVLCLALYERLKEGSTGMVQAAVVFGIIWAGSLIASGMVLNAGIAPTVALYASDPVQATSNWSVIEAVSSGLGNGNGEILGGLLTLLISWAAFKSGKLPKPLNILGILVGVVGIVSLIPALNSLIYIFGLGSIAWCIWLGFILLRKKPAA